MGLTDCKKVHHSIQIKRKKIPGQLVALALGLGEDKNLGAILTPETIQLSFEIFDRDN